MNEAPTVNDATIELMFSEAQGLQSFTSQWSDAIDAKVLVVFGGASALIGAIPAIGGVKAHGWEWLPWIVAGVAWAITSLLCSIAYGTRPYRVGPEPSTLAKDAWVAVTPEQYRYYRLQDMGGQWDHNWKEINKKATALGWAIPLVAIESGALLIAMMLQR